MGSGPLAATCPQQPLLAACREPRLHPLLPMGRIKGASLESSLWASPLLHRGVGGHEPRHTPLLSKGLLPTGAGPAPQGGIKESPHWAPPLLHQMVLVEWEERGKGAVLPYRTTLGGISVFFCVCFSWAPLRLSASAPGRLSSSAPELLNGSAHQRSNASAQWRRSTSTPQRLSAPARQRLSA